MKLLLCFWTALALSVSSYVPPAAADSSAWHLWSLDDVDAGYYVHHGYTSIAMDREGKVHVSYRGPDRVLKYISNRTGSWVPEMVFSGQGVAVARESSLAIDSSGLPHISFSYSDGSAEDLKYARKKADGTWEVTTVFTTNSGGMENGIALDAQDKAHVSHWQWNGDDLLYSTNSGGDWTTVTLDDAYWARTTIAVDSRGEPHFVYRNSRGLIHSHGGTTEVVDAGNEPALAIDAQDHLHVSYTAYNGDLKYATNAPGFWKLTTIAPSANPGRDQSIAVDPQNKAHVSYRDETLGSLFYANNVAGFWHSELVDQGPALGRSNSIAAGANGRVVISYRAQNVASSPYLGVWGDSSSNVFIVGERGAILRYDGASLSSMESGTTSDLHGVWGSASSNVIAVGGGTILRYDGVRWTKINPELSHSLYCVWGSSASEVFAAGSDGSILRYDGHSWSEIPSGTTRDLLAIWGASSSSIFAAGSTGTVLHYDGNQWSAMSSGTDLTLWGVWGTSPTDVFAVGNYGTILHYDGQSWSKMSSGNYRDLYAVWGRSGSDVFAVGSYGTVLHYDGQTWAPIDSGIGEYIGAVWTEPSGPIFVAGYHQVRKFAGTSWRALVEAKLRLATNDHCIAGSGTGCLLGGRFRVEGEMKDFSSPPRTYPLTVMSFPDGRAETEQAVSFESFTAGNFEAGVKMVDGCALPPGNPVRAYWAFFGGLTNAQAEIGVEDTVTGQVYQWLNPAGRFPITLGDTSAFPCIAGTAATPCARGANTACLLGSRFRVTGRMLDFSSPPQEFPVAVMSFPGGRAESDQAVFFQSFNPGNFEVGVKMVDGCSLPAGHPLRSFWVFYGGLTNAETTIRVTQVATGLADTWTNPRGLFPQSVGRTGAFPCY
jgi:hypothetical protein